MVISVCFSWTLDPYIINFRFCLAVVSYNCQMNKEKSDLMVLGCIMTIII